VTIIWNYNVNFIELLVLIFKFLCQKLEKEKRSKSCQFYTKIQTRFQNFPQKENYQVENICTQKQKYTHAHIQTMYCA